MTLMTTFFGRRINKEIVEDLLRYMGEDTQIMRAGSEAWTTKSVHGKCRIVLTQEGLDIDLYVFRRDEHYLGGDHRLPSDNCLFPITESDQVERFHKLVPYKSLEV